MNLPDVGDILKITIPWPSEVHHITGGPSTEVLVRREPDVTSEEVFQQLESGTLKELYRDIMRDSHFVIMFGGERWIYDFLGCDDVEFTGSFSFSDEVC